MREPPCCAVSSLTEEIDADLLTSAGGRDPKRRLGWSIGLYGAMQRQAPASVIETPEFLAATRRLMDEAERAARIWPTTRPRVI